MSETIRILIIEDRPEDAELVEWEVRRTLPDSEFMCVETETDFLLALESFRPDIILSDFTLPKFSGMAALKLAKKHVPEIPFILVTGSINEETAVDCMKAGAADYIIKDRISRIGSGILKSMEQKRMCDETRRSEHALKESRATMAAALASMTDAVFISDINGKCIEYNDAFATFYKFESADECNKQLNNYSNIIEMFMPNGALVPPDQSIVSRALRGETATNAEYTLRRKDIDETWVGSYSFGPILNDSGAISGSVVVARDITEHKKSEAERERLALAIEQVAEIIVITDPEGTIQYVNPAFETITGYSRNEAVGQNMRILKSGKQDEQFYQQLWQTISSGRIWSGSLVNRRKNSEFYTEEVSISPVLDASGKIVSYVGVKKDVTAELEKEKEFQQAQKMESIGQLAGGVAHDFNNKLQVILGVAEMALSTVDPASDVHEDLTEISKAAKQSSDLTRQLLTFARKQAISPKVLDLNEVIENVLKMLRRLIGEDIDLLWHPSGDLWPVKMDPSQIDQILANLCVNARDAINGVGAISIKTQNIVLDDAFCSGNTDAAPGDYLMLSISDDGCGMEKELLKHIFEPFYTSKAPDKGTGLGLATVYGIVKQNNGIITLDSVPGKGTTFNICLSRCMDETSQSQGDMGKKSPLRGQETILLVEDAPAVLHLTQRLLETLGYRVLTADIPSKALHLARKYSGEIHLLVTDVIMPEASGPELAAQLQLILPNLKCLFMSGYIANAIGPSNVLPEGVQFIQKPFELQSIAVKLRSVLDDRN